MFKYIVHKGNNSQLLIMPALEQRGNWAAADEAEARKLKASFIWTPVVCSINVMPIQTYNKLDLQQDSSPIIHNHLENIRSITTKPGLLQALRKYYGTIDSCCVHDAIPTSYIIRAHLQDLEYRQFVIRFKELRIRCFGKESVPTKHCFENMWVIKPATLNQGRGIEVCKNLSNIKTVLQSKSIHSVWVVQKYIERPLLYKGRKFDIRVWALMTARHELFYYRKGYLRTSSSTYEPSAEDNYIHLTNNCLQKNGKEYGVHEAGNTLSFNQFQQFLDEEFTHMKLDFWTHMLPRMKDLMIDVFVSSTKSLQFSKRDLAFELVGFDFLIDEDFRVWLIEVNTNPYLGLPNVYIEQLVPKMVDDMLAITVDPYIPPAVPRTRTKNGFELLYSEGRSVWAAKPVNKRASFDAVYPFPEFMRILKEDRSKGDPLVAAKRLVSSFIAVDELAAVPTRIVEYLRAWREGVAEHILISVEALKTAVRGTSTQWIPLFAELLQEAPLSLLEPLLEALYIATASAKMRLELLNSELVPLLLAKVQSKVAPHKKFVSALLGLSKAGVPRDLLVSRGVLTCLYIESLNNDTVKASLDRHYQIADWELLLEQLEDGVPLKEDITALIKAKVARRRKLLKAAAAAKRRQTVRPRVPLSPVKVSKKPRPVSQEKNHQRRDEDRPQAGQHLKGVKSLVEGVELCTSPDKRSRSALSLKPHPALGQSSSSYQT